MIELDPRLVTVTMSRRCCLFIESFLASGPNAAHFLPITVVNHSHDTCRGLLTCLCSGALSKQSLSVQMNVVVMRGVNDDELADFVELTRTLPINVRFIEYMPFDGNVWSDSKMVSYADMMARVLAAYPQGLERFRVRSFYTTPSGSWFSLHVRADQG